MNTRKKVYLSLMVVFCIMVTAACSAPEDSAKIATSQQGANDDILNTKNLEGEAAEEGLAQKIDVEEQVLLDQDGIVITLKSLEQGGMFGPSLKVLVENNSETSITVQTRQSSINGVMADAMFSCEVGPGKKANDSITFMDSDLEEAGISTIKDIELKFNVFETDNWDGRFESDVITITTTADPSYVQTYDDSGIVVMDDQGFKIIMKRVSSEDSFWGADVYVYIENNSETDATFQARDVSINGFMIDPIFSSEVLAGKKAYDTLTFFESDLTENGIEFIDDMEVSFHIFNASGWDTILDTPNTIITFE